MSAWQVMIDGILGAAELVALLLVSPAAAMEAPVQVDVRLRGTLADVRISQSVRNDSGRNVNLAARLPAIDEHTEALRIHRRERIVDLLENGEGCGGDDSEAVAHVAGHARLAIDEAIADAMQLAPGETALIETIATQPLVDVGAGRAFRLALPAHSVIEPRAFLIDQHDAPFLIVIADHAVRGVARLTLRPSRGASEPVELGQLTATPAAYVIPLSGRAALTALAAGAIELEARAGDYVLWSTLAPELRTDASLAAMRAPE